jgi:hypothetical protein
MNTSQRPLTVTVENVLLVLIVLGPVFEADVGINRRTIRSRQAIDVDEFERIVPPTPCSCTGTTKSGFTRTLSYSVKTCHPGDLKIIMGGIGELDKTNLESVEHKSTDPRLDALTDD